MPIYRLNASVVSRSRTGIPSTSSAVAAAAYNAREPLYDERQGVMRDLAPANDLISTNILLPESAPDRFLHREVLWNEVERTETRKDAQLARSIILTLPRELTTEANVALAQDFASRAFVSRGMVADVAVHSKVASDGLAQPHAHMLLTMRRIQDGVFGLKERAWNTAAALQEWRATWADMANRKLREAGITQITHKAREHVWVKRFVQAMRRDPVLEILEKGVTGVGRMSEADTQRGAEWKAWWAQLEREVRKKPPAEPWVKVKALGGMLTDEQRRLYGLPEAKMDPKESLAVLQRMTERDLPLYARAVATGVLEHHDVLDRLMTRAERFARSVGGIHEHLDEFREGLEKRMAKLELTELLKPEVAMERKANLNALEISQEQRDAARLMVTSAQVDSDLSRRAQVAAVRVNEAVQ